MSEKENKVLVVDPKTTYVKVRDMSVEQINLLDRFKTTLVKTKINGILRYRIEIELDGFIHIACSITEAVYVNTLLQWNENERREKDRFYVSKKCPVYLVRGTNTDGSEYIYWQLILYKGRTFTGLLSNDQITTVKILERRGVKTFTIVNKPETEEIIADSVVE